MERGLLSNAIFPGELTGVRVSGKANGFLYGVALYAGDQTREFTEDSDGNVVQAYVGYDFKKQTGLDKALVRLDYQYGTDDTNAGGGGAFEHAFSLNATVQKDAWLISGEILGATGRGTQGDVVYAAEWSPAPPETSLSAPRAPADRPAESRAWRTRLPWWTTTATS